MHTTETICGLISLPLPNSLLSYLLFHYHREKERALAQGLSPPIMPQSKADLPRFTGGGFSLKQSQQAMA